MSRDGSALRAFLTACVRAFDRSRRSRSSDAGARPPSARPAPGNSWLRGASPGGAVADASPGQVGDDATRDLTASEIRRLRPSYEPAPDGDPDPGEVVWTWVPYAEHDGRGKDRPVLIIARIDAGTTAGCYLSTKQHRDFVSVGSGGWDPQGRTSYLAPDRILRITDAGMRREGHVLAQERFTEAVDAVAQVHRIQW